MTAIPALTLHRPWARVPLFEIEVGHRERRRWQVAGHCRILRAAGKATSLRRPPPGGWAAACRCGWTGGISPVRRDACAEYVAHLMSALPICSRCQQTKARREMSKASPHLCKPCRTAITRAWALANPETWERHGRRSHLKTHYGITPEEFDAMLAAQGGVCAICRQTDRDSRGFRPHVDHDHTTGKVRAILCGPCNRGIGQFADDPDLVQRAVEYLRLHGAINRTEAAL